MAWHGMACHACARRLDVEPEQLDLMLAHKGRPLQPARRGRGAGSGVGGHDALLGGVGTQVLELMMVLTSRRQTSGGSWHHTNIGGGGVPQNSRQGTI